VESDAPSAVSRYLKERRALMSDTVPVAHWLQSHRIVFGMLQEASQRNSLNGIEGIRLFSHLSDLTTIKKYDAHDKALVGMLRTLESNKSFTKKELLGYRDEILDHHSDRSAKLVKFAAFRSKRFPHKHTPAVDRWGSTNTVSPLNEELLCQLDTTALDVDSVEDTDETISLISEVSAISAALLFAQKTWDDHHQHTALSGPKNHILERSVQVKLTRLIQSQLMHPVEAMCLSGYDTTKLTQQITLRATEYSDDLIATAYRVELRNKFETQCWEIDPDELLGALRQQDTQHLSLSLVRSLVGHNTGEPMEESIGFAELEFRRQCQSVNMWTLFTGGHQEPHQFGWDSAQLR
jgi:hypothetical protein